LGAETYVSGAGAKAYNDPQIFNNANVNLQYSAFEHPVYRQEFGEFIPGLSILDVLFNEGLEKTRDFFEIR